jgi:probable phosphoglycerate mutase
LRAEQTTEVLLEANGDLPVSFERAWRERGLGVYQGLSHADIESRFPEFSLNERGYRATERTPDGGESLRAVERRVVDRFEELADADGETVLVVTHGGPLCILLGHTKGMDLTESLSKHHLDNCAFAEFRVDGEETTVVSETLSVSD